MFLQTIAAIIVANGVCFAFFMGAMKASRLQKNGAADDELPWWVYICLIVAPALLAIGSYLLESGPA